MRFLCAFITFLFLSAGGLLPALADNQAAKEQIRLLFATFEADAAGKYGYLRDGTQTLLASRLAAKEKIVIIDQGANDLSKLQKLAKADGSLEATAMPGIDYLVTGALFEMASGIQLQVALYPLANDRDVLRFSVLTTGPEGLVSDVEDLASRIAREAFGQTDGGSLAEESVVSGQESFITAHPEAAFKRGLYTGTVVSSDLAPIQTKARGVKREAKISGQVEVMAVGDLTGDQHQEIVALIGRTLMTYRVGERSIDLLQENLLPIGLDVHALSIADINGDGVAELYVSATEGLYVQSAILHWGKTEGWRLVRTRIPWYLRPVELPVQGWVLAGQQRGIKKTDFVAPGVFTLSTASSGDLEKGARLPLPAGINLFDFIYAEIDGESGMEMVCVDSREKIRVYSATNELIWVSEKNYGGNKVSIGPSWGQATDEQSRSGLSVEEDASRTRVFVPGKIIAQDLNGDGRQEIVVVEQEVNTWNFLTRIKMYNGAQVAGLSWSGGALTEIWRTGKFQGYISGYDFALQGDTSGSAQRNAMRQGRLTIGSLPTSGTLASLLPGNSKSLLTVLDLEFTHSK